jgi:DNA-binding transcriptional regulator YiaG
MKKQNDTMDMEEYLEAHASELIETEDNLEDFIRSAKKDNEERKTRAAYLQSLRRDKLKLSQSELAKAVGANVRTLQGWETGRQDYPKAVEILMTLMKQVPQVKRMLTRATPIKKERPTTPSRRAKPKRNVRSSKKKLLKRP